MVSPFFTRSLAILLVVAIVASIWSFVVTPVLASLARYDEAIGRNRELLGRYLQVSNDRKGLEAQIDELRKAERTGNGFLQGNKPELASAGLVKLVKKIIALNGGKLQRTRILRSNAAERFPRASIRVFMTGPVEAMQKIFHAVDQGIEFNLAITPIYGRNVYGEMSLFIYIFPDFICLRR